MAKPGSNITNSMDNSNRYLGKRTEIGTTEQYTQYFPDAQSEESQCIDDSMVEEQRNRASSVEVIGKEDNDIKPLAQSKLISQIKLTTIEEETDGRRT